MEDACFRVNIFRLSHICVLFIPDDLNNNNTCGLCRFGYEWVYYFLPSTLGNTRRETQFIKAYANQNMQTPSTTTDRASCRV